MLNQVEYHPYLQQAELTAYCKEHGIGLASYGGLMPVSTKKDGPVNAVAEALGAKHHVTDSEILLAWNLAKCQITVTTSSKEDRLTKMLGVETKLTLSAEEIASIDKVGATMHHRQFWGPQFGAGN